MVKQIESWENRDIYEQEQDLESQAPVGGQLVKVEPKNSKKTSSIPSQLYYRLGLSMRSEEHTSELQSQFRISYAVFCLKKKNQMMIST